MQGLLGGHCDASRSPSLASRRVEDEYLTVAEVAGVLNPQTIRNLVRRPKDFRIALAAGCEFGDPALMSWSRQADGGNRVDPARGTDDNPPSSIWDRTIRTSRVPGEEQSRAR
jgi:hypothetical protein